MKSLACVVVAVGVLACGEEKDEGAVAGPEVVHVASAERPLDATPSPDGAEIYFVTATALYRVADPPVKLADVAATSVVATDDALLVGTAAGVVSVPPTGGTPTPVPGTEGFQVGMLDLAGDLIIAGADSMGAAGVFAVDVAGGTPEAVVTGLAAVPNGVLALPDGDFAVALPSGLIVRANGNESETLYQGETLGTPAGMALAPDGTLMISSLSAEGTAQVVILNLETRETAIFNDVIGANEGAGGLHQAEGAPVYAWADAPCCVAGGGVYRIRF